MTLRLALPPGLEDRLRQEAQRCGEATEAVALRLLDQHLPPPLDERRRAALTMLMQWIQEDTTLSAEEAATNATALRALDEDRPSHRKLFSAILQDEPQ
jgi:hypothetical protein